MTLKNLTVAAAVGSLLALGSVAASADDMAGKEKCYGVAKAGKNDCATAKHGCATEVKKDRDPQEWITVPTGTCEKIAGGSTTPGK